MENESIPEQTGIEEISEVTELPPQEEQAIMTTADNSVTVDTMTVTEVSEIPQNDLKNTLDSEEPPQSQAYDDIVVLNHNIEEQPHSSSKPEEKIQNLTSEWSEDEYDVAEDAPATLESISRSEVVVRPPEPEEILEETIENIQQEVLNHVTTATTLGATIEPVSEMDNENPVLEEAGSSPEEPQMLAETLAIVTPMPSDPQAQQKISSLLNDWEDNDSQEENNSEDAIVINKEANDTNTPTIPKPDIKSLVSDWDDDEEDNKE
ncbi:unnamed protein product [Arctia plantaginis]|nr:unnamed protein product [Arctia plantaginis]